MGGVMYVGIVDQDSAAAARTFYGRYLYFQ